MQTTRAESASDSRANSSSQLDASRGPMSDGAMEVFVLHVQPRGMPGFVLDVYGSRVRAVVDAAVLRDGETAVSVRGYRVDAPQVAGRVPAGGER